MTDPLYFTHRTEATPEGRAALRELLLKDGLVPEDIVVECNHSPLLLEVSPRNQWAFIVGYTAHGDAEHFKIAAPPFDVLPEGPRPLRELADGRLIEAGIPFCSLSPIVIEVLSDATPERPRLLEMTAWMVTPKCEAYERDANAREAIRRAAEGMVSNAMP